MSKQWPDKKGHFGIYGGRYAAETLMPALIELEEAYLQARKDKAFQAELDEIQKGPVPWFHLIPAMLEFFLDAYGKLVIFLRDIAEEVEKRRREVED